MNMINMIGPDRWYKTTWICTFEKDGYKCNAEEEGRYVYPYRKAPYQHTPGYSHNHVWILKTVHIDCGQYHAVGTKCEEVLLKIE